MAWGIVNNDSVNFGYIGLPAFYTPVVYNNEGEFEIINIPLIMTIDSQYRRKYEPDLSNNTNCKLYRKFYASGDFMNYARGMVGGKFQGSNRRDFSDVVDLAAIDSAPEAYHQKTILNPGKYRYLRYMPNRKEPINIAEIEFWGLNDKGEEVKLSGKPFGCSGTYQINDTIISNAFDGNIRTNCSTDDIRWIGLDLGECKASITKIGYLPRNNYYVIEKNHEYELIYLDNSLQWVSLGRKIADKHVLTYDNIPCEALFILKNHTSGVQERTFMYDCEKHLQYWF